MMRRAALMLGMALGLLLALEQPAAAHGAGGIEATNYETTLDGISPALPGVRVRVIDSGDRLELHNDGPEVVVLGYQSEPYLRIGPEGTFENRLSPAVTLNRSRRPGPEPPGGEPEAPPDWRKLSDDPVARWHDHRIHWMGAEDPLQVKARPGVRQVVQPPWAVPLRRGAEAATVSGQLTWVPGPSPFPWFGVMAAAFFGVAALGLLRRWGAPLAAAVGVLLAVHLLHAFAAAFGTADGLGRHLMSVLTGNFYSIAGWALSVVAVRLLARGRVDGLYPGVFAGLSVAVFGGLLDLAVLVRSVTPFALSGGVARLCVAVAAGGGPGLVAACLLVIRRTPEARHVVGGPDEGDAPLSPPPPAGVGDVAHSGAQGSSPPDEALGAAPDRVPTA